MFNVDAFNNDMAKRSVPGSAAQFSMGGGGKRATLYVFTPSMIPQQILRSYKYDFNGNLVDDIIRGREIMQRHKNGGAAPNGLGMNTMAINSAILPNPNGIPLDMSTLSNQWTFVLLVDSAPAAYDARRVLHSPTGRVIATGFCSDEPINRYTGTPNPAATLIFTKSNSTMITPSYGCDGIIADLHNANDLDVVSELNAQITPSTDLYVGTPQDIRSVSAKGVDGELYGAYGELCLNNVKEGYDGRLVRGQLKTPKIQLGQIVNALDAGINYATAHNNYGSNSLTPPSYMSTSDIAEAAFDENVCGSREMLPLNGLDTSKPMSMSNLCYIFPDLEIVPFEIPMASPWDTTPQDAMTARNSMSSMLSASLSSMVPTCGLSNIFFRYSSYMQNGPGTFISDGPGVWEIYSYGTLVACEPRRQEACVTMFERYFEMELAPILKLVRGDFDLMAYIDASGYILVDLNYKADAGQKIGMGFYETSSRLGGFVNPLLADFNTINHNATQLQALVTDTLGKQVGIAGAQKPLFESDPNASSMVPPGTFSNQSAGIYSNLI